MSRIPTTKRTERTSIKKTTPADPGRPSTSSINISQTLKGPATSGRRLGTVRPSEAAAPGPSLLQKRVFKEALAESAQRPGRVVQKAGVAQTRIAPPKTATKRGKECVVQKLSLEKIVQRCPKGEYIAKTATAVDVNPRGEARQLEYTTQKIDPTHGTESAGINETIRARSSLSVTSGGKQLKVAMKKRTVVARKFVDQPNLNPHHVKRLILMESEDVDNTLRIVPPDLVSTSLDKFAVKKKLQALRLSSEPISLLTQSVMPPASTADEAETEAPPEVVAAVIHAVEKGATPQSAPNQIFNSLFPNVKEPRIGVSSVAPGPLEDIVVPTEDGPKVVEQVLTAEMEDFISLEMSNKQELPKDDICSDSKIEAVKRTPKGDQIIPSILDAEVPPWEDATVQKISVLVGGGPIENLDVSDLSVLESPEEINEELSKGVDYFIDADVVPFETKIQIRGSKLPKWFPGYMSAFPHLPGFVNISKTPSEVLHAAWKAVQPKVFPEESILIA